MNQSGEQVSRTDSTSSTNQWIFCGEKCPRTEIIYITQVTALFGLLIIGVVMLIVWWDINDTWRQFWICVVFACLGYLMPEPKPRGKARQTSHHSSPVITV